MMTAGRWRTLALGGLVALSCSTSAPEDEAAGSARCAAPNCSDDADDADLGSSTADPRPLIRFDTTDGAAARRAKLLEFLWPGGVLPEAKPVVARSVAWPDAIENIDTSTVARVDRLDATITGTAVRTRTYALYPRKPAEDGDRVVFVHQGHVGIFDAGGLGQAATFLLQRGFIVVAMHMPLFGWNARNVDGLGFHGKMFENVLPQDLGLKFRYFIEPIIQNVNHFSDARDIAMIGVSGGGWATSVAAAVDPRIRVSMEVAGSAPLYLRTTKALLGDREQYEPALYGEEIAADGSGGGITTYLELYVLAGHGADRRAIQVNNQFDPCCFAGGIADSYAPLVSERVRAIGAGSWSNIVDEGATEHRISENVLANVLTPALSLPAR